MGHKIFVNLPVADLKASMAFFEALGFSFNPQFTDETAACMIFSEDGYAMLPTHAKFREFTSREIADTSKTAEMINALSCDSRADVDRMTEAAVKAGGVEPYPARDHGFMYQRAFSDLDGHAWEILWMDPSFIQPT